jgi:hypothetical protein
MTETALKQSLSLQKSVRNTVRSWTWLRTRRIAEKALLSEKAFSMLRSEVLRISSSLMQTGSTIQVDAVFSLSALKKILPQ